MRYRLCSAAECGCKTKSGEKERQVSLASSAVGGAKDWGLKLKVQNPTPLCICKAVPLVKGWGVGEKQLCYAN